MRYEDVAPLNPRLIYASMTGYGESGPDAEQPGFDSTAFFARSGLLDALTHEGGPPAFSLPAQGDQMAGMNLFAAIAMALLHRERTGEGSEVSSSLHAGGLWSNAILAQGALLGAYVAPRPPRTKPRSALANQYRTSDGRWIQLTIVREDKLWPELCKALERPDLLDDPRFQTTDSRRAHAAELAAILDPVFAAHPWPEWRKRLRHHEITFGLLGVLRDVPHDHQAVANGAVVDSSLPDMPRTLSAPIRLSFAPEPVTPGRGPGARRAHRRGAVRAGLQPGRDRHAAHGGRAGLTTSPRGFGGLPEVSGRFRRFPRFSRHETLAGPVAGVSAISASVLPIADSSARRPDPGAGEYLRTARGARKRVSASFRRFPPLRDIVGRARIS